MKKLIFILPVVILTACNPSKKPDKNSEGANPIVNGGAKPADSTTEGERLISIYNCSGCHNLDTNKTGPSFVAIARRYPNGEGVAENLAHSILYGSKGAWGTKIAMPPHNNIRYNDAVKMAEYILSLRAKEREDSLNTVR
ncbi:MAG TPA: c-type cytochrome [Chitinophagaceae bacterium]|nr:c-type cytochrome [Chitinophagaceae bacterium]